MAQLEVVRPTRIAVLLLLGSLPAGCAVHSAHDRGTVSDRVRDRTGHALRPAAGTGPDLPECVSLADGLSEDEAVAVALWRNADLEVTLAEMGLVKADLVEAGLIKNPIFSILFPLGPKQLEFTLTWPIEALWQRPRRVAAAQLDVARTAERLVQGGLDLVRDVRLAYADVLLEEERARLAAESRDVRTKIAAIADVQQRVGDISPLEAAAAQVESARARDEAQRASRAAESSRDRLLTLLGLAGGTPGPELTLAPAPPSRADLPGLDTLLTEAFAARPELRAVEVAMEAAGRRAGVARSEILTLSALLDANGSGREGFEMGRPRPRDRSSAATGPPRQAEAELDSKRGGTWRHGRGSLEVRQPAPRSGGASPRCLEERHPGLEQSLARVEKAREAGDASLLEALAARRSVLGARLLEAEARAAERRAEAALGHGVGRALGPGTPVALRSEARP
jgi:cobalt-zinc-cadmium efflux system outer membrane protein